MHNPLLTHEALDRTSCMQNNLQSNLIDHAFYNENAEFKAAIDAAMDNLAKAYQIAGAAAQ